MIFTSFHFTSLHLQPLKGKVGRIETVFYCLVAQSCLTLCHPIDCNPPGSSVQGIFQARILEYYYFLLQGIFLTQRLNPCLLHWQVDSSPLAPPRKPKRLPATTTTKSLQSCPALCDPIDGSPPGSSVHGILQARTLEWVAISSSNA